MSNLVLNSDFSSPALDTNSYVYYDDMITEQQNSFSTYWNTYNNSCLQNGNTIFGYPDPSGINVSQFVSLQQDAVIYQDITIPQNGVYELSFYYATRDGYDINPLQISFGNFTDIIDSNPPSDWTFYTNTLIITSIDVTGLAFVGIGVPGVDVAIALTNISLVYVSPINYPTPSAPVYNTVSNGYFTSPTISSTAIVKLTPTYSLPSWSYANSVIICGQTSKYLGYQYPAPPRNIKYVMILPNSSLSQIINFTKPNDYILTFHTCRTLRTTGGVSNGCNIYFDGFLVSNLIITAPVSTTAWTSYSFPITVSIPGNITLSFQTYTNAQEFPLAMVNIYVPTSPPPDPNANCFSRTTIYGPFSVQDKYSTYDDNGNYSGSVSEVGKSTFWGDVVVKGNATFYGTVSSTTSSFTGPQGPQGLQGIQGLTGPQGLQGIQGNAGAKGDTGPQGIAGTNGTNGAKGDQGIQGIQGIAGTNGTNGTKGDQGIQGIQGIAGTNGTNGAKGDTGPQGIQGIAGTNGTNGAKGDQGIQGIQGAKGDQGIQGIQGIAGTNGTNYFTQSGSNIYYTTGNIGIGKTNPSSTLDVNGNVNVSGNLTSVNITSNYLCLGSYLKFGVAKPFSSPLFGSVNLTWPLDPIYFISPRPSSMTVRLPDINQPNISTPFIFVINTDNTTFKLVPYSSNNLVVSNLYDPMWNILAYQNMTPATITCTVSSSITILYMPPHWQIMYPY